MGKGERDKLRVGDWNIHTIMYKIDKQQDLLYRTRNYTQYLLVIYNGKESEKEYMHIYTHTHTHTHGASLVAQSVKNSPAMQESQVWSLGREDPMEKEMATHFSIHAWRIPWTEEPSLVSYSSWDHKELDTTEWLTISLSYIFIHTHICIWITLLYTWN